MKKPIPQAQWKSPIPLEPKNKKGFRSVSAVPSECKYCKGQVLGPLRAHSVLCEAALKRAINNGLVIPTPTAARVVAPPPAQDGGGGGAGQGGAQAAV